MMINNRSAGRGLAAIGCVGAMVVLAAGCASTATGSAAGGGGGGASTPTSASTTTGTSTTSAPVATTAAGAAASPTAAQVATPVPVHTTAAEAATSTSRCHTEDLSGAFTVVRGSQGAGNIVYNIELTNITSHTCTIYGHPGLLLLNAAHGALPTDVMWNSMVADHLITLAPGKSASASARFSPDVPGVGDNPGSGPGWTCEPTAVYTEITPPDETAHLVVPVSPATPVCERGGMSVSAFVAGSAGPGEG
jgi:hypothetical protein